MELAEQFWDSQLQLYICPLCDYADDDRNGFLKHMCPGDVQEKLSAI